MDPQAKMTYKTLQTVCESILPVVPLNTIHNQYNLQPLKYNKYYPTQRDL